MKEDYAHISIILDRTGSMQSIRDDTIGGFNTFLEEQKKQPGKATLTLVQFDTVDPYEVVHHFRPIEDVPELTHETYVPRSNTPLLDAFGRGINDVDKCLAEMKEEDKPSKVIFAVITDGQENSSREFNKDDIVKMIKEKTDKDQWEFVFLSADLDAIQDAKRYGIPAASTMSFAKTGHGTRTAWAGFSGYSSRLRQSGKEKIGFGREDEKSHPKGKDKKRSDNS